MQVREAAQEVFVKLVAWECFGESDLDPKELLREVPLPDLHTVSKNIKELGSHLKNFACVSMVELELLFKSGMLLGDWEYQKDGERVHLAYEPISFPRQETNYELEDLTTLEHLTPVGASA